MVFRLLLCIFVAWCTLYRFIAKQNELTELRLAIPVLSKDVKLLTRRKPAP